MTEIFEIISSGHLNAHLHFDQSRKGSLASTLCRRSSLVFFLCVSVRQGARVGRNTGVWPDIPRVNQNCLNSFNSIELKLKFEKNQKFDDILWRCCNIGGFLILLSHQSRHLPVDWSVRDHVTTELEIESDFHFSVSFTGRQLGDVS